MALHLELASHFQLDGHVAVITGAASGLGREAARVFALAGATVILADVDPAGLDKTAEIVRQPGGVASIQPADVSVRDQVEALGETAIRQYGRLDHWINCAGITMWREVAELPTADVDRVVAVNMMGTLWGCSTAGRIMKERGGGSVINISSVGSDTAVPGLSVYGMTKAGVNQLTAVAAKELGPFGIRVNAILPGWIDTPINTSMYRDAQGAIDLAAREGVIASMKAVSPLGMTGEPVDIGLAMLYLASDAARFVTGHLMRVSGGA